jgi:hypothetical protein
VHFRAKMRLGLKRDSEIWMNLRYILEVEMARLSVLLDVD